MHLVVNQNKAKSQLMPIGGGCTRLVARPIATLGTNGIANQQRNAQASVLWKVLIRSTETRMVSKVQGTNWNLVL
jgi:hypothetical protein